MNPKSLFLLLALLWLGTAQAMPSPTCAAATAYPHLAGRTVTVWNYFGHDFNTAGYFDLHWHEDYGYYVSLAGTASSSGGFRTTAGASGLRRGHSWYAPNPAKAELESGSEGESLIDRNQFFPLVVMERSGYIDADKRAAQSQVAQVLHPDQVLFFELSTSHTGKELIEKYGKIPEGAREEALNRAIVNHFAMFEGFDETAEQTRDGMSYQLKEGAAWLLSGQPNHAQRGLYLEPGLVTPIDRATHPFVWEIGRAAQVDPGRFFEAARVAVYYAARELILLGGNLEDGYVFAHALNSVVAQNYTRKHKFKEFSRYKNSPSESCLRSTLADLIDWTDIALVSPRIASLRQASPDLSRFEALKIVLYAKQNRTEYLTSPTAPEATAQLRDFSHFSEYLLRQKIGSELAAVAHEVHPLTEYRDMTAKYAEKTLYPYSGHIDGVRMKNGELMELDQFLTENNAIEVTSTELSGDTQLAIAYWSAVRKLAVVGEPDPEAKLKELGINFALFNGYSGAASTARWHVHRPRLDTLSHFAFNSHLQMLRPEISASAQIYSAEAVATIAHALKAETMLFSRGDAHRRQYFSNPELMGP